MNKLPLIIKREYIAKVRNKSFVVMTFLSPFLMVGMILLIAYLTQLNDNDKKVIGVLNDSSYFSNEFVTSEATSYINFKDISLAAAKDSTLSLGFYGLIYLPDEPNLEQVAQRAFFYSKDAPSATILDKLENSITGRLRQERLREMGLSPKEYAEMDRRYNINIETFDGNQNIKGINEIKAIIGGAFGYLIMMFIIIYGGFVMRSVIEEKTSRIIEVIISSVKPFHLMMGKIIGTSLAGITQFAIWIVSGAMLLFIGLAIFDIDPASLTKGSGMTPGVANGANVDVDALTQNIQLYAQEIFDLPIFAMLFFFIVYFVLGYLIYSSIYAAIGAAVDNETDTQQFIFPVILPLMLAIYVGFFSVFSNPNGPIAVAFSLFPLTSPIVMLMRLPWGIGEGGVPVWQLITSILILIGTFIGIVWVAAKIYRVGILMYGKKPSYKELYKWLKYSS